MQSSGVGLIIKEEEFALHIALHTAISAHSPLSSSPPQRHPKIDVCLGASPDLYPLVALIRSRAPIAAVVDLLEHGAHRDINRTSKHVALHEVRHEVRVRGGSGGQWVRRELGETRERGMSKAM